MIEIAIVVMTHRRPAALSRLLSSLKQLKMPKSCSASVIVSIDHSPDQHRMKFIADAARQDLDFANVILQAHPQALGIVRHLHWIGELTQHYQAVVVLEDDLYVSPYALNYVEHLAQSSLWDDPRIAAFALYSPRFNETALLPFYPNTTYSGFLMQLPCSWGQLWTREQWLRYSRWQTQQTPAGELTSHLPANIQRWSKNSWKRLHTRYLIARDLSLYYPSESYTTNFGDAGQHMRANNRFQVPLSSRSPVDVDSYERLPAYDAFTNPLPDYLLKENPTLARFGNFSVDLHANKPAIPDQSVVLSCYGSRRSVQSYCADMLPIELGCIAQVAGEGLYFTQRLAAPSLSERLQFLRQQYRLPLTPGLIRRLVASNRPVRDPCE